jgi:signal transduction histidine kinase
VQCQDFSAPWGRQRLGLLFGIGVLVLADAVTPLVSILDDWAAKYGTTFGTVVPWAIVIVQLLVTPVLYIQWRRPALAALLVTGTTIAGCAAMIGAPAELYTTYVSTTVWVPIALSSVVPGMIMRSTDRRRTILMWGLLGAATLLACRPWEPSLNTYANGILHVAVAALIGMYIATRFRMVQALRDRADRAEREQHLLAERALTTERARLASEMHDVVSHRVSLMVLQAGALRLNAQDDATRAAAEDLRATGCQALDELRDLVGVLRRPPGEPFGDPLGPVPEPEPAPDLAGLVEGGRAAGIDVRLRTEGDPGQVAPVVARTVHRVAREALTNAGKHAHGASVTVDVRYGTERVRLEVANTAPPDTGDTRLRATGAGTGLAGLRQRVEVVGGAFTAGPTGDGGFAVAATMPVFVPTAAPEPELRIGPNLGVVPR